MTLKMNRETGQYEAQASFKFWMGLGAVMCTTTTAVVTYTITLTLAFTGVRQDIALLKQQIDLQQQTTNARLAAVERQLDAVSDLATAVRQLSEMPPGRRVGGNGGNQ